MRSTQKINPVKAFSILFIALFILSFAVSQIFSVGFVEEYLDDDGRIGEHVNSRITIFQTQMFHLSIFFLLISIVLIIFSEKLFTLLSQNKELFTNLILVFFVIFIFFIAGEVALRLVFSEQIYSEYGQGPGGSNFNNSINYNSLGFRDVEHDVQNLNQKFRILVIGDSFTFGAGINDQKNIYSRLLQKKLDTEYGENRFEVINMSVQGYSTIDALEVLTNKGIKFNPDLIILGYYINDAEGLDSRVGFEDLYYHHYLFPYELGGLLYRNSFMYYFAESRAKNVLKNLGFGNNQYTEYINHLYSDSNPFFNEHEKYLENFIALAKDENAEVVVMNIPVIANFDNYAFSFVDDYVEEITTSNNAKYFSPLPHFSGYSAEELRVSFMDSHLNELGHTIVADALFDFLGEESLLEK